MIALTTFTLFWNETELRLFQKRRKIIKTIIFCLIEKAAVIIAGSALKGIKE